MNKLTKLDILLGESFETLGEHEQEQIFTEMIENNQETLVEHANKKNEETNEPKCCSETGGECSCR